MYSHDMVKLLPPKLNIGFYHSEVLVKALYIGDAFGLSGAVDERLQHLDPAPAYPLSAIGSSLDKAAATQWSGWWSDLLEQATREKNDGENIDAHLANLKPGPTLWAAAEPLLSEAKAWYESQLDPVQGWKDPASSEFLPRKTMGMINALLRRNDRYDFENVLFLPLPLAGSIGWPIGNRRYIVSNLLVRDSAAFENWFAAQLLPRHGRSL